MREPEKYLPMNRAELIARCEALEAAINRLLEGVHGWVAVNEAKELLK